MKKTYPLQTRMGRHDRSGRKRLYSLISLFLLSICFTGIAQGEFFDDFSSGKLDSGKWLIAEKSWGRNNGGVVPENVSIKYDSELGKNVLCLEAHGDFYNGSVPGVDKYTNRIDKKTRVGAAVATSKYYASGIYEVRMKVPKSLGACSALWTFHYEEAYEGTPLYNQLSDIGGVTKSDFSKIGLSSGEIDRLWTDLISRKFEREPYIDPTAPDRGIVSEYFRAKVWDISKLNLLSDFNKKNDIYTLLQNAQSINRQGSEYMGYCKVRNHEIDIELPTGLKESPENVSYSNARFNTWIGECGGEYTDNFNDCGYPLNDDKYHTYTIIWHTDNTAFKNKRVAFYIDGRLKETNYTHIPNIAGRFWIGIWFPEWSGSPDFSVDTLKIDWIKIVPFNESGDDYATEETYPDFGWSDSYPETIPASAGSDILEYNYDNSDITPKDEPNNETVTENVNKDLNVSYDIAENYISVSASSSYGLKRVNISDRSGTIIDEWLSSNEFSFNNSIQPGRLAIDISDYNGNIFHDEVDIFGSKNIPNDEADSSLVSWSLSGNIINVNITSKYDLKRIQLIGSKGELLYDSWGDGKSMDFTVSITPIMADTIFISDYNGFGENIPIDTKNLTRDTIRF